MIGRREFLYGVAAATLLPSLAPSLGEATRGARGVPRVGVLGATNPVGWFVRTAAADIECRWADEQRQGLPALAAELARLDLDVMVALGAEAARAARSATATLPVVFVTAGDPVRAGLVDDLGRPGANLTGITVASGTEMAATRLDLLSVLVPGLSRMAVLGCPGSAGNDSWARDAREAGAARDIEVVPMAVTTPDGMRTAFAAMSRQRVGAVAVLSDAVFALDAWRITALASAVRVPAVYEARSFVEAGGLMAAHADGEAVVQRTVAMVGRILTGESPATLPVEALTHPALTLNRRAARALGLTLPPSLLARADAVLAG